MRTEKAAAGLPLLQQVDARLKLIMVVFFSFFLAFSNDWFVLTAGLVTGFLLLPLTGITLKKIICRLLTINSFVFLIWLIVPLTAPGTVLYQFGPFSLVKEGLYTAGQVTLRANAIFSLAIAMLSTTPPALLAAALAKLHFPSRLTQLFFMTYRYLHEIKREYNMIYSSARLRGFQPGTSLHSYKIYAFLLGQLLLLGYDRSSVVVDAMICRGYSGDSQLSADFSFGKTDYVAATLACFVLLFYGGLLLWR